VNIFIRNDESKSAFSYLSSTNLFALLKSSASPRGS